MTCGRKGTLSAARRERGFPPGDQLILFKTDRQMDILGPRTNS